MNQIDSPFLSYELFLWSHYATRGKQKSYRSQEPQYTKQFSVKSETNHFEEALDFIKKAHETRTKAWPFLSSVVQQVAQQIWALTWGDGTVKQC